QLIHVDGDLVETQKQRQAHKPAVALLRPSSCVARHLPHRRPRAIDCGDRRCNLQTQQLHASHKRNTKGLSGLAAPVRFSASRQGMAIDYDMDWRMITRSRFWLVIAVATVVALGACVSPTPAPSGGVNQVVSTTSFGMCQGYCSTRLEISPGQAVLT